MTKAHDNAGPESTDETLSATERGSKGSSWEFTPKRRAAFERAQAAKRLKAKTRAAQRAGVNTLGEEERPGASERPGGPTTSDTPHEPAPRRTRRSSAASDVAPERDASLEQRHTSETSEPEASDDAAPTRRSLEDVLRLAIGLNPKGK